MKKPAAKKKLPDWPASKIEIWPLAKIIPYPNNARTHPPDQIEQLAQDMREDGVTAPIMVDESGVILYGHGRRLAAIKNKFEEYPVIVARGWSNEKKRAVRIKDNQRGLQSGWDKELLRLEVGELKLLDFDLGRLGFPENFIVDLLAGGPAAPGAFPTFGEDIETEHECPKCHYRWSGNSAAPAVPPVKTSALKKTATKNGRAG